MKHSIRHIIATVAMLTAGLSAYGGIEFQVVQLTTMDGLANNTVRQIMQDSEGRIWIGTSNGLSCYDGREFKTYRVEHDKGKPGLKDQRVVGIYEDAEHRLWITSPTDETACFDIKRGGFIDYKARGISVPANPNPSSREQLTDAQGRVWRVTGSDGLYVDDMTKGITEHFTTQTHSALPTNALKCIFMDRDGQIWIGTDNLGISRLRVMQNDGAEYMLDGQNIRMIAAVGSDRVAVANRSGDLWIYDAQLGRCVATHHYDANTYYMTEDVEGVVWRGTKGDGLYIGSEHYLMADSDATSLAHNDIYSICFDGGSRIWVGTFGGGLCLVNKDGEAGGRRFTPYLNQNYGSRRIRAMAEDGTGHLWVATSDGIYVVNPTQFVVDTTAYCHLCEANSRLLSDEVRTLYRASDGSIYVSEAGEGFSVWKPEGSGEPSLIRRVNDTTDSLVSCMVQCFVEDLDGMVWVSTELGISRYNPSNGSVTNYFFSTNMLNNVYSEGCGVRLGDGRLAFGTNNGVVVIDPQIYNRNETKTPIGINEVTVGGQSSQRDIIFIVRQWWNTPWAIAIYIVLAITAVVVAMRVRHNNRRFHRAIRALKTQREDIREQYSQDVRMRRHANREAGDAEFIVKVESIVDKHLADPVFSPDDMADQMYMGRTTFYQRMRQITGFSPREYINLKRMKRASHLISTTSLSMAEISDRVGISDPLYFSRLFRKTYGCSPSQWRRNSVR